MRSYYQTSGLGRPLNGSTVSPYEAKLTGRYVVEKLLLRPFADSPQWVAMANGNDADGGLDRLIRTAEAVGGDVRIVRRKDGAVVWSRKSSHELEAATLEIESI